MPPDRSKSPVSAKNIYILFFFFKAVNYEKQSEIFYFTHSIRVDTHNIHNNKLLVLPREGGGAIKPPEPSTEKLRKKKKYMNHLGLRGGGSLTDSAGDAVSRHDDHVLFVRAPLLEDLQAQPLTRKCCTACVMKKVTSVYTLLIYTIYPSSSTHVAVGTIFRKHTVSRRSHAKHKTGNRG